jgi:hypothetical protein
MRMRQNETTRRFTSVDWLAVCIGCAALLAGVWCWCWCWCWCWRRAPSARPSASSCSVLGVGSVAFVSLVFLLVGESEDHHYGKGAL